MTAARLSGPLDELPGRFEGPSVMSRNTALAPRALDLRDHVLGLLFISSAHQHMGAMGAMGGEGNGRSPADTARRGRDQGSLPP